MLDKLMFWKKHNDLDLDFPMDLPDTSGLPTDAQNTASPDPLAFNPQGSGEQAMHPTSFNQPDSMANFQQPSSSFSAPQQYATENRSQYTQSDSVHPRDIELILAKLETIKSSIDHLSTRVESLEQQTKRKTW